MNWTPGKIVGTVKPVAASVAPIPATMLTPVPAPLISVTQPVSLVAAAPAPVPAPVLIAGSTSRVASNNSTTNPAKNSSVGKLKGTVQNQPSGANKILGTIKVAGSDQPGISSDQLTNQAIEEIYRDVKIGRIRASQVGALGWRGCPLKKANKHFLNRTMRSVMTHNRRETIRTFHSSTRKLIDMDRPQDWRHRERTSHGGEKVIEVVDDEGVGRVERKNVINAKSANASGDDEGMEEGEIRSDGED